MVSASLDMLEESLVKKIEVMHEIQDENLDRADILVDRAVLVHDEYILFLKDRPYRQIIRYFNRHCILLPPELSGIPPP